MNKETFIQKVKPLNLVKKKKGRWGTIHFELGHIQGDYQKSNLTFNSIDEALEYLYDKIFN